MLDWLKKILGLKKNLPKGRLDRQSLGALGESLACEYLESRGYAVMERNFRCPIGELDVIARKGEMAVFVEVKTQYAGVPIRAERKVDARKQRRLKKLAAFYKKNKLPPSCPCRIDVIICYVNSENALDDLKHYERAM